MASPHREIFSVFFRFCCFRPPPNLPAGFEALPDGFEALSAGYKALPAGSEVKHEQNKNGKNLPMW